MLSTTQLQRHLEADSVGLLSTIAEVAEIIGLPIDDQRRIQLLATGVRQPPNRS